jgi:hypothetical protein
VGADSPTDAWAIGTYCAGMPCDVEKILILHLERHRLVESGQPRPPSPGTEDALGYVAATTAANAWAVGGSNLYDFDAVILHWNGTAWSRTTG